MAIGDFSLYSHHINTKTRYVCEHANVMISISSKNDIYMEMGYFTYLALFKWPYSWIGTRTPVHPPYVKILPTFLDS